MAEIRYTESVEIAAPTERVFDYRLDLTNLPAYNPHVSSLRRIDGGQKPGPGAEYLFDLTLPGLDAMETPIKVTEALRPKMIGMQTGPGYMARETCRFTRTDVGTRCDFEITLTFPGEIPADSAHAMEGSGREQLRMELDNMKRILEGAG